jgi:Tol biopolymer transport system component/predicted Ser/Thr protein kinase
MGEVYKARDSRLDRIVAVKVVSEALGGSSELRDRFEREARAIGALNHPHICTLHDVGHEGGIDFIVMEYVEGASLAERLLKGPLPLAEVLRNATEIADALDKAHRAGITHRDLKPANVMLTKSGTKLLDFGLAKVGASTAPLSGVTMMPTTPANLTAQGTILGTFQYMAPEQLEGADADARTDIFAFGALVYEMATGRKAFDGKNKTSLIAAIVSSEPPPLSQVLPLTPPALEHLIQKCLAKDPADRWQSAHDVAEQLRWIAHAGSQAGVATPISVRRKTRERIAWVVAGAAIGGLAIAAALLARSTPARQVYSFTVPRADDGYEVAGAASVSPNGERLAFTARAAAGKPVQLFVRSVSGFDVRALDGTQNAGAFSWSLDSGSILFVADGSTRVVDLSGAPARVVAETISTGAAMNRDGVILLGSSDRGGIMRASARGGAVEPITTPDSSRHEIWHALPTFLPDGRHFLFINFVRDPTKREQPHSLYAGSLDSKETKLLGEIPSQVAYVEPGYLLFVRDGTLMAVRFDAGSLTLSGEPRAIADGVNYFKPTGEAALSASTNGVLTYRGPAGGQSITWVDRSGQRLGTIGPVGSFSTMRFAPNDDGVIASVVDRKVGTPDVWLYGTKRETATRLTYSPGYEDNPVPSPDGRRLVYAGDALGVPDIFIKELGSAADDRALIAETGEQFPEDVSPDGTFLVYTTITYGETRADLFVARLDGSEKPFPFVRTPFNEQGARFSPDGRSIAYQSNVSGQAQVYLKPFPGPGPARPLSTKGGTTPRWSKDGRQLYFKSGRRIFVVDMTTPDAEPRLLFEADRTFGGFDVAPDGQRFLMIMTDELAQQNPTRVIVNWPELLTKPATR